METYKVILIAEITGGIFINRTLGIFSTLEQVVILTTELNGLLRDDLRLLQNDKLSWRFDIYERDNQGNENLYAIMDSDIDKLNFVGLTLAEIKHAVDTGKTVCYKQDTFRVIKENDNYIIKDITNNNSKGLTWADNTTLNGSSLDFYIKE